MKFLGVFVLAPLALAVPATLASRWNWGSCSDKDQYSCTTTGLLNALNCVNLLDGTTLDLGILSGLRKRKEAWQTATEPKSSGPVPYCCTTTGLLNILNCDNILDGDDITVQIL